jgi:hypothetical protein
MGDATHTVPALDEADVPMKTMQGLRALRAPERSFTMNARALALLKLADGKRSTHEIRALDHGVGDTAEVLGYLHMIGLVQIANAAQAEVPMVEQPTPQPTAPARQGYSVVGAADVAAARRLLVDWAVKALGPDGSVRLTLQVEKAKTRDDVLAMLERMCTLFSGSTSKESIQAHRADTLRVLGLTPATY